MIKFFIYMDLALLELLSIWGLCDEGTCIFKIYFYLINVLLVLAFLHCVNNGHKK